METYEKIKRHLKTVPLDIQADSAIQKLNDGWRHWGYLTDTIEFAGQVIRNLQDFYKSETIKPVYEHYKGSKYVVIDDNAKLESTGEIHVYYKNIETGESFFRPKDEFFETVDVQTNTRVERFKKIES